jgi:hypothetical protein
LVLGQRPYADPRPAPHPHPVPARPPSRRPPVQGQRGNPRPSGNLQVCETGFSPLGSKSPRGRFPHPSSVTELAGVTVHRECDIRRSGLRFREASGCHAGETQMPQTSGSVEAVQGHQQAGARHADHGNGSLGTLAHFQPNRGGARIAKLLVGRQRRKPVLARKYRVAGRVQRVA